MNKIRKGDQVVVLSGKDKGRQGTVLLVDGEKVTVENINKAKKHQKPRQGQRRCPSRPRRPSDDFGSGIGRIADQSEIRSI